MKGAAFNASPYGSAYAVAKRYRCKVAVIFDLRHRRSAALRVAQRVHSSRSLTQYGRSAHKIRLLRAPYSGNNLCTLGTSPRSTVTACQHHAPAHFSAVRPSTVALFDTDKRLKVLRINVIPPHIMLQICVAAEKRAGRNTSKCLHLLMHHPLLVSLYTWHASDSRNHLIHMITLAQGCP